MDRSSRQARYHVRLYDPFSGNLVAIFDDFRTLQVERYLNSYDIVTFSIAGDDPRVSLFALDAIIEVWRRVDRTGSEWYKESVSLHRTGQHQLTERQLPIFTSYSRGLLDFVRRRTIAYYANTAFTLKSGPGEQVIKEIVNENCAAGAVAPRVVDGAIYGLLVEANAGLGDLWSGSRSWQNVLEVIAEIGAATRVDFQITRYADSGLTFIFSTGFPQLGTDRSTSLVFSPTIGNMVAPSYTLSRTEEATRVIVLGQGQEDNRQVVVRDSIASTDSPWNLIETTTDARNQNTLGGLNTVGDLQLQKVKAQESFAFTVLQIESVQYGADYFLGDIISAGFGDVSVTKKIVSVKMNISEGRENIAIEFADLPVILP